VHKLDLAGFREQISGGRGGTDAGKGDGTDGQFKFDDLIVERIPGLDCGDSPSRLEGLALASAATGTHKRPEAQ
jgi:hypothetical protein